MDNNWVAQVIEWQFDEWLLNPRKGLKTKQFKMRSYKRWAIQQICWELRKNPLTPPLLVVQNFIQTITGYRGTNRELRYIYKNALDVAYDVLDLVANLN